MRIRENLGTFAASIGKTSPSTISPTQIGKVFGVITTENTPTKELFEKHGGWSSIGTIFYIDFTTAKNITNPDLNFCKIAKPFHASTQNYPLVGELVHIIDGPSPSSQVDNTSEQKYYTGIINLWNNSQVNSPTDDSLGKTFVENSDIKKLISFEGDRIYQGRKGNGIRFGSTVKSLSNVNEWSNIGNDGDPITILVNGYVDTNTNSLTPNVEEINTEMSSIYMTSTQKLPLQPGGLIRNPISVFSSLPPNEYINSQIILNSDRVTLNSKKDEVLLFAKTNIGLNTDNNIILNAGQNVHINIESKNPESKILLGTKSDNTIPDEPVLLGGQTHDLLLEICRTLNRLAYYLSTANVPTSDGNICISACNDAGSQLFSDVNKLIDKLGTIQSNKVFTV